MKIITSTLILLVIPFTVILCQINSDTSRIQADSIMKSLHKSAFEEMDKGNFEKAEIIYRKVVWLKERYAPNDSLRLMNVYSNYAFVLNYIWKFDEALKYYEKCQYLINKSDYENLSTIEFIKGNQNAFSGDLESAINNYKSSLFYLGKSYNKKESVYRRIYLGLNRAYLDSKQYDEAMRNLNQNLKKYIFNAEDQIKFDLMLFDLYCKIGDTQNVNDIYLRYVSKKIPIEDKINMLNNYAIFNYFKLANYDEALKIYERIYKEFGNSSEFLRNQTDLFPNIGNCYERKKQYKTALEYYQKTLLTRYPDFGSIDFKINPPYKNFLHESINLIFYKNKGEILYKYSKAINDTSYLEPSLQCYMRALKTIYNMRFRITSEQGQFMISSNQRNAYNTAQYIALDLYEKTKNKKYLDLAFEVNEHGRAFTLLTAIRNQKAMDFGNLPSTLILKEKELNRQISLYEELIYKEKEKKVPDQVKISNLEMRAYEIDIEYKKLLASFEKDYPEYYRLKFDNKVISIDEIKEQIPPNTTLIEYVNMDSVLLIYTINRHNVNATRLYIDSKFDQKCTNFLNIITFQDFSKGVNETFNEYTSEAYELYNLLISPVLNNIEGDNLIIIPDGAISFVPFDALLTSPPEKTEVDYRHLQYLIKKYSVGYSYSSTLHFNPLYHLKIPDEATLAYAPLYGKNLSGNPNNNIMNDEYFKNLVFLPGVKQEVMNISGMRKTKAFYAMDAMESSFKDLSGRFKIIHLAMHTDINNKDPMLSKLIFTQIPDGAEDGLLHTFEIYNLKLSAQLTVLSSCSSGVGIIQPGEGVQSLARGFAYAGCPSILMTLWEIGDMSSVLLMTDFYKYLEVHMTKPQALRVSKLNYLQNSDNLRSNPYFWAAYVVIGDSSPIYPFMNAKQMNTIMILIPFFIIGIHYHNYRIKEKRRKQKQKAKGNRVYQ